MIAAVLGLSIAMAGSPDDRCVSFRTGRAPLPDWVGKLGSNVVLGEFAVQSGSEWMQVREVEGQRAAAAARDAFMRTMEDGGRGLKRLARDPIDTRWGSCPYFPPVPVVRGACPLGMCRPIDTRSDRCGYGPGRGEAADAALAVRTMVRWGVNTEGEPSRWDVDVFVGLLERESVTRVEDAKLRGEFANGCTPAERSAWVELGTRVARALLGDGG